MIQFSEVPYLRPDMDRIRREMEDGIAALKDAKTFEEAYAALLRLLDLASPTLVPYRPGDTVRFHPIEAAEYRARVGEPMEAAR